MTNSINSNTPYDEQNIFAKILRAELPCIKVYEDDNTLTFMDVMPQAQGHVLVIPKEPAVDLLRLSNDAAANLIQQVQVIAKAVQNALNADGISIFQLNGSAAGQTVPHIHFHILPGSVLKLGGHASGQADPAELQSIADKIKAFL